MDFTYNNSCNLALDGDYLKLKSFFQEAVRAFNIDSDFCIPGKARHLLEMLGAEVPVVMLGTTMFSSIFVNEAGSRIRILAAVDDFKAGEGVEFHGYPIITSEQFRELARSTELVAVTGCRADHPRRYFKRLTHALDVPMLNYEQAIRWLGIECSDARVADWGSYIAERSDQLISLGDRLVDDYSRFTLYSVLLGHLTCDLEWIFNACKPYPSLYFRSGLWSPGRAERFADCGASIAESTMAFLDATNEFFDKIWLIEPDELNQQVLAKFIEDYQTTRRKGGSGSIELLKCAVSNEDGEMPFLHQGGHGGHLLNLPDGTETCRNVRLRTLDDLLPEPPTLIKMDIEGAELEALKGARRHILDGRPKLAISAYHRKSDLLDISQFVTGLHGDYKIGLRHHTQERWDTCLYFY